MSKKTLLHGNLSILIKKATGIKNMDGWGLGKSDPYVILELDGNRICRSKTIEDNLNPVWNQPVVLQLCSSYRELKFTIYDEDNCSKDDAIGTVIVPTESFANGEKIDQAFQLTPNTGQLELTIKFISIDKVAQSYEVPEVPFTVRQGNKVVLYQKAHIGQNSGIPLPIVVKPHFGFHSIKKMIRNSIKVHQVEEISESNYTPANCWEDVTRAIYNARKFIYITGWSVWVQLRLIRGDFPEDIPLEFAKMTLGEMLKQKASEGVRVLLLVWNEATSAFGWGGLMGTHDEETHAYFQDTGVKVKLAYRKGENSGSEFIWTHHQKSIILDAPIEDVEEKRRIIAFVGGLDLTDGRYDTPKHSLFRTLKSHHSDDFHQVWQGITPDLGPREPWHDIHSRIEGPIARDVLANFESRWKCQAANNVNLLFDYVSGGIININEETELFAANPNSQWNCQFFRSIDQFSAIMATPEPVEKSIQLAYIHQIRRAKHFLYIENQYFLGSAQAWLDNKGSDIQCNNLIPVEIAEKIVASIKKRKAFCAYILVPMYPEGIPEDNAVQEILYWQWETIKMMYKKVHTALVEEGLLGAQKPEDYLNFYCLGQRETEEGSEGTGVSCEDPARPKQKKLLKTRRFMIYVHSKMMIVDDEYVILGSANINERSMAGDRDTEIAIGSYQPQHVATASILPRGDVHAFRLSLWAAHTGVNDPIYDNPQTPECARHINEIAQQNWDIYAGKAVIDLPAPLMKYPLIVGDDGIIQTKPGAEKFPDTTANVNGSQTNIPNLLTL